ncbi:tRNA uridine-5-carboxymethylaminomethyl(34) synthesis enzyme MnmG [Alistipes megaguti]|uniref:tRNA uridine-5-carboxymethylaminomethyl(34) synthesis enzyme MnmG n=1 Tax=Alistipes megaguti TaxID=2364787 RepID=UPI0023535DC8|nr:tRNA uridine-5-carboxymethylaminomethyl(34) synthesis enzyme MnmG [Alistipes megaguti]
MTLDYDIIVIGGGHAGCEAASAAARLGSRTLLLTMDMTKMAAMSCNPAVGGVAKGQIVREIDALGGEMGRITDRTAVQFRMLNMSKGAAMWSPRAQCDKTRFSEEWRHTLENTPNLYIWQDAATELLFAKADEASSADLEEKGHNTSEASEPHAAESQKTVRPTTGHPEENTLRSDPAAERLSETSRLRIRGVRTRMGVEFSCRAVVLTAGTFLDGMMHCGAAHAEGGRAGDAASHGITGCLVRIGFETGRMKTGTPARLDARTIHFEEFEPQYGDEKPSKFSFSPETEPVKDQMPCYLVYTTPEVHAILRSGFDRSPLFNGTIHGIGPRYCPSIEDKLRTFADKDQHQLFLEPEGRSTNEYYLNGFSSSLPWEVQWEALHKIRGFEDLHIYRPGYAIEYDYFPPIQLEHSLETKLVSGLFFAGQVNGTTGYEEAAAQGLMAGINAHRKLKGEEPIVLKRDEAYIGVLIDDLVTKGVDEPYRMFTSRAEYRILLRQDNADMRLTPLGYKIGLISEKRYAHFEQKKSNVESLVAFARETSVKAAEISDYLKSVGSEPLTQGRKLHDILMRNNVTFESLEKVLPKLHRFIESRRIDAEAIEEAEIQIKYKGYIEREKFIAEKLRRLENIRIPGDFDFFSMNSLTIEARQKLSRIRPKTIGQASRIPGVSPADVNVLLIKFGR